MSSSSKPIQFYNRYSQSLEEEAVYGDGFLKWAYENPLGQLTTELIVKRALFSKWYGWRMDMLGSKKKVLPFIEKFKVDEGEFLDAPDSYRTFNEFFYRKLKASARPIDTQPDSVVFPADGRHLGFPDISEVDRIFVKGQHFDLPALLGDKKLAEKFAQGSLVFSRLCPVDYHRYHFPCDGTVVDSGRRLLNGVLYSVNPIALKKNINILWQNKRYITEVKNDTLGSVLILEVGATCVGSAIETHLQSKPVTKGGEKGYFRFGGSTVITLFEPGAIELADDLVSQTQAGYELYAKMGDFLGAKK